jgi:hypothetical protein
MRTENRQQAGKSRSPGRSPAARYLLAAGLVVVMLLVIEGLSYVVFRAAGFERYSAPVIENPHHPYLGWTHGPHVTIHAGNCGAADSLIRTNADGYSITPHYSFAQPVLRIVVSGGSAVMGSGTTGNETSLPAVLEQLIVDEVGINAEVYNIAGRGYQSFQEMLALLRFSTEYDYDLVIAVGGSNDARIAAEEQDRQAGLLPGNPHRASEFVRSAERDEFIVRSPLTALRTCCYVFDLLARLSDVDEDRGRARTPGRLPSSQRRPRAPDFADVRERAAMTAMNYSLMERIARNKGAEFIMVLQPTLWTKPALTEQEKNNECMGAYPFTEFDVFRKELQGRFHEAFVQQDKNFVFVDGRGAFDGGSEADMFFVDRGHYNDHGAATLARFVLENIRPALLRIMKDRETLPPAGGIAENPPPGAIVRGEDVLAGRAAAGTDDE